MNNKYDKMLAILFAPVFIGVFCVCEYIIFTETIIGGIIGNIFIATVFFLLYKSSKYDAVHAEEEQ